MLLDRETTLASATNTEICQHRPAPGDCFNNSRGWLRSGNGSVKKSVYGRSTSGNPFTSSL